MVSFANGTGTMLHNHLPTQATHVVPVAPMARDLIAAGADLDSRGACVLALIDRYIVEDIQTGVDAAARYARNLKTARLAARIDGPLQAAAGILLVIAVGLWAPEARAAEIPTACGTAVEHGSVMVLIAMAIGVAFGILATLTVARRPRDARFVPEALGPAANDTAAATAARARGPVGERARS
jgi:hypothetical protein